MEVGGSKQSSSNSGNAGAAGGQQTTGGPGGNGAGGQVEPPIGGDATGGDTEIPIGGDDMGGQLPPGGGIATGGVAGKATTGVPPTGGVAGKATTGVPPTGGVAGKATTGVPPTGGVVSGGQTTGPIVTGGTINPSTGVAYVSPGEADFSMDPGWLFIKQDVTGADAKAFDDSKWAPVSTPHTYNDIDSFRVYTNHSSGDTGTYQGKAFYRKHFKIPADYKDNKVIIEFQRIKTGAKFWVNGTSVGVFYDGISPCGIDVTKNVTIDGTTDNVLAVAVDNGGSSADETGTGFQWNNRATNPNYGGIVGHVWLHLPGKVYQTYPLYYNLKTSGIYVWPDQTSFANMNAQGDKGDLTLNVEAEVSNESGSAQSATLGVKVIDPAGGATLATFSGTAASLPTTGVTVLTAKGPLTGAKLWSDISPNLYSVVTTLTVGGKEVNGRSILTGFRKVEMKGGAGTGGVYINGRFVYLLGYAQRASNEWAGLGSPVPDWMRDYHAKTIRDSNSNYIRWMHISPHRQDVLSHDKYGVVNIAPAGDKESDPTGQQWTQRVNVMRSTMIYLRNNPSVFFYEAGNTGVTAAQMKELHDLMLLWDPHGGRGLGDRDMADAGGKAYAEWFGTMIAYEPGNTAFAGGGYFRGYSNDYRDKGPILEEEDFRDEAFRGIWDDQSPPSFGFKPGPTDTYHWNSETFTTAQVARLDGWLNLYTIKNTDATKSRYSSYGSIYFSDSDADGRTQSSAVCRVSGKVDAVRLPKEIYYSFQVAGSTQPAIHIIGHWTYPAATSKTMIVLANHVSSVELFVNGTSKGKSTAPANHYAYSFPSIAWASGSIKAVGYDSGGQQVCQHEIKTAGAAAAIKLTPTTGPDGLKADGQDVVMYDFEIVDANGQRCPTDETRVDFAMTGPGIWRGGLNARVLGSTNNTYLKAECGINRVFIKSTQTAGDIKLTATATGLTTGEVTVTSKAVPVKDGLIQL
jgi:beta-galactosidase